MSRVPTSAGLLVLAFALAAGCRDQSPELKPVGEPSARVWTETIDMPVLGLRIGLEKGKALFRDDGFFRGELTLHTADLAAEPEARGLVASGRPTEALMLSGTGADGVRRAVVWASAAGDPAERSARREGLRAAAAIRLGHRAEIEEYFRSRGLRARMQAVSHDVLVAMVEVYALHLQGSPIKWVEGSERQQAAGILMAMGVGEK